MSEKIDEKKEGAQIPTMSISSKELENNRKNLEEAKIVLTPPDGQVLVGMRSFCPIHGDITRASKILKHTVYMKNEESGEVEPVTYSDVICLACFSKFWRDNVVSKYPAEADGSPGEIKVAPVFISKEEYEKLIEEQKAEQEKLLKEQEAADKAAEEKAKN